MKKNMGTTDRAIRIIIALAIAILYFTHIITGTLGLVLLVMGCVLIATSLINFCPLYRLLGINTCKLKGHKKTGA